MSGKSGGRILVVAAGLSIFMSVAACSDPSAPEAASTVNLTVSSESVEDPGGDYIRVTARLNNATPDSVTYYPNCGQSYWFAVLDEGDDPVQVSNPAFGIFCPRYPPILAPRENVEEDLVFAWGWTGPDERYRLPTGEYTVRVQVLYYEGEPPRLEIFRQSIVLQWE